MNYSIGQIVSFTNGCPTIQTGTIVKVLPNQLVIITDEPGMLLYNMGYSVGDCISPSQIINPGSINQKKIHMKSANEYRIIGQLNNTNAEQRRLRNFAIQAWEATRLQNIEFTIEPGQIALVKNYPKLAALPYCTAIFEDGIIKELIINGVRLYMVISEYKSGEPTKYTRPDNFAEFLKLNNIPERDIYLSEFKELIEKSEAINKEFKAATEKFDLQKNELNMSFYSRIGLFSQQNVGYTYKYVPILY